MKIKSYAAFNIVGRPEPGEYQGSKTYKLNVLAGDSAGDIKCSEDVYKYACGMEHVFAPVKAELLYNSEYKTIQITRILPEEPANTEKKPSPAIK